MGRYSGSSLDQADGTLGEKVGREREREGVGGGVKR